MLPLLLALAALPDAGLPARPVLIGADHLDVQNKQHRAVYKGHAKIIRDSTTITCDELEILYDAKNGTDISHVLAHRNVEATDGARWAKGDEADYDNATGVLVVTGHPVARQGVREVQGEVVTFTTGTDTVVVTKAKTRSEENTQKLAIDADTLTLENPASLATWRGHVRARRGPTLLLAPVLIAHYDDAGTVTHVEAHGGMEAFEADRWAKGRDATYDVKTGVLVVTGNPEAKQGKTHVKGTRVTFTTGQDVIDVEHATTVIEVEKKAKAPK